MVAWVSAIWSYTGQSSGVSIVKGKLDMTEGGVIGDRNHNILKIGLEHIVCNSATSTLFETIEISILIITGHTMKSILIFISSASILIPLGMIFSPFICSAASSTVDLLLFVWKVRKENHPKSVINQYKCPFLPTQEVTRP